MSDEEMLSAAASVAGVEPEELKKEYGYEGESRLRCYNAGTKYILVSSAGVESLTDSRLVEEAQMDMEQARQLAEEFLAANGYEISSSVPRSRTEPSRGLNIYAPTERRTVSTAA